MVDPTGNPKFPESPKGVLAITRHPLMWAFMLWAACHALLWPTPAVLIVAGGIGLLALVGALGQDAKKARLIGPNWVDWEAKTSFVPFGVQLSGRNSWRAAFPRPAALIGGLIVWLAATWLHPVMGGPTAGPWMWLG